ncbi:GtrA family protein [Chitinibacteraceae bacterium HSL-7]
MKQLIVFTAVGATGTLLHFAVLSALMQFDVPVTLATTAGAIAGAAINYVLNHRYTFAGQASHRRAAPRYYALVLLLWALNAGLMALLVDQLHWHYLAAQVVATVVCFVVHYLASRSWVFRESQHG